MALTFLRDGADKTADVTLAALKDNKVVAAATEQKTSSRPARRPISPAKQVSGAGDKGVVIVNVDPNGAAANKGLAAGDVILEVAGKQVSRT